MALSTALIVEDHQNANDWLQQNLKARDFEVVKHAYYCDDALLAIKNAIAEGQPFDLLVTDLSFVEDPHRKQRIENGADLIVAARMLQPELKVLVFSAETQPVIIDGLFQNMHINGFILKGRRDTEHLNEALDMLNKRMRYIPAEFKQMVRSRNAHDFTDFDIAIISRIAEGKKQKEITAYLHEQGFKASSLSSIEKRLNTIREALGFTNNAQLIAYCKDYKVIY